MKKILLAAMACMLILASCNKTPNDNPDPNGPDNDFYLTATIDGAGFTADLSEPTTWGAFKYHQGTLTISVPANAANAGDGTVMLNLLNNYTGPGNYTVGIGSIGNNYARYTKGSMATGNFNSWNAETSHNASGTGTIILTADANNIVEGSFSFTGYSTDGSSKAISEGKFRLKVQ